MKTIIILILAGLLASCGIPVAIGVQGEHGTYGYSSKGGLTVNLRTSK